MQTPYSGRYINLDRSAGRRDKLEKQLRDLGVDQAYQRFSAVDGLTSAGATGTISPREYGCFASHTQVLKEGVGAGAHLHVLEDDALLSAEFVPAISKAIGHGLLDKFDILFTDVFVPLDPYQIHMYERVRRENTYEDSATGREILKDIAIFDLQNRVWACTSSYLVSQRSVERISVLLANMLVAGPKVPVDLALRQLVNSGVLKAAVILPFLTSIDLALDLESTVREIDLNHLARSVLRHTLCLRPDWALLREILQRHFPSANRDQRRDAIGRVLEFAVFGDLKRY
jgi:GR25 family glycosyltransferase involved in LPS biosynthesis